MQNWFSCAQDTHKSTIQSVSAVLMPRSVHVCIRRQMLDRTFSIILLPFYLLDP